MEELTPRKIVDELDKYIVGQAKAKRSVAIALRNRYRRQQLSEDLREEITPKNILMIGPTGVGKTEIARRLAKLVNAPFVKVEATKFTEVGYVGRDVESMVRDLVETSIRMVRAERMASVEDRARMAANDRILELLVPSPKRERRFTNPFEALIGGMSSRTDDSTDVQSDNDFAARRQAVKKRLDAGDLEDQMVEFEVEDSSVPVMEVFSPQGVEEMGINIQDILGGLLPKKRKKRKMSVAAARKVIEQEEAQKLIDHDEVTQEAVHRAEQFGIIFVDEIDKIASHEQGHGPDVSREGVQRDILPIVEGSTVMTKYGPVKTDHMLFIAAGAFHISKPSDLIPELQGRFPIRVELESLSEADFRRILTEPQNALVKQYSALLAADGVKLEFAPEAIDEIARIAAQVNAETEDIGARRLHTIMERLLEDVSYAAPDNVAGDVVIDREYVRTRLKDIANNQDLSRYIL